MEKSIIIVTGNVCSGKSYVVKQLKKKGYKEVFVDDVLLANPRKKKKGFWYEDGCYLKEVYDKFYERIVKVLKKHPLVVIEATGTCRYYPSLRNKLRKKFGKNLKIIFVKSFLYKCLDRVKVRNLSKDAIRNTIRFVKVVHKYQNIFNKRRDIIIENNRTFSEYKKKVNKLVKGLV